MTAITSTLTARTPQTINGAAWRRAFHSPVAYDRANDSTAYAANDVVSTNGAARSLEFKNCGARNGGTGLIHRVSLTAAMVGVTSYSLLLFNQEPTNFADNAALALAAADRRRLLGHFLLAVPLGVGGSSGIYTSGGQVGITTTEPLSFVCEDDTSSLWGLLVTGAAGNSTANAEFVINLHGEQDL